jgi:LysR substrate binding domain
MSRIGRTAKGGSQTISVGTMPLIAANIMPQAIKEFRGQRSDLRIQLFDADLTTLLQRLEAGKLDMAVGIFWFKNVPGFQRTVLFRFSPMVLRADKIGAPHRASTTWSALNGQTLISHPPTVPHQQIIDKCLAKTGVVCQRGAVVNLMDTQIALVEADEGIAIIPSYGVPVCRNRKVVISRLINRIVNLEFSQISGELYSVGDSCRAFVCNIYHSRQPVSTCLIRQSPINASISAAVSCHRSGLPESRFTFKTTARSRLLRRSQPTNHPALQSCKIEPTTPATRDEIEKISVCETSICGSIAITYKVT